MTFFDWSVLDWSIRLALILPVLSLIAVLVLRKRHGAALSALLLSGSGVAGIVAGVQAATSDLPFTLETPAFFSTAIVFDKFSALFFTPLSFALVIAGLTLFAQRPSAPMSSRAVLHTVAGALAVIGMQWVFVAGSSMGLLAGWQMVVIACVLLCVPIAGDVSPRDILRVFGGGMLSVMMIMVGLFLLSSGALFSDFGTLSYIAAQITPHAVLLACIFLFIGFGIPLVVGAFFRATTVQRIATAPAILAVVHGMGVPLGLYGMIRALLFILPPLSLWFAFPLLVGGIFAALFGAYAALRSHAVNKTLFALSTSTMGSVLVMMGLAMCLQTLGAFEPMNVVLFAALLTLGSHVVAMSGMWIVIAHHERRALSRSQLTATGILALALSGVPPMSLFVGMWMTGNTLIGILHTIANMWFALGTAGILLLTMLVATVLALAIRRLFLHVSAAAIRPADGAAPVRTEALTSVSLWISAVGSIAFAVGAPRILEAIGAGPLTLAPQTWFGGILASSGILQMTVLLGMLAFGVLVAFAVRKLVWGEMHFVQDAAPHLHEPEPIGAAHFSLRFARIVAGVRQALQRINHRLFLPVLRAVHMVLAQIRGKDERQIALTLFAIALTLVLTFIFAL